MSQTTVKVQIQQRIDTSSNWTSAGTTVLLSGEIGWESDTKKYKIGDGSTAWSSLAYAPGAGGYTAGNGVSISASNVISASAIALSQVFTAANETAMLALTTQEGDVVVRSDQSKTYMKNNGTAGSMADFTELATPTDAVTSVNGNTGAITADQLAAAIESATDSNTFTDADHTKLNSLSTTTEGTAILSTGETSGTKFLREDGDGSCSWQSATVDISGKADLSGATFTGDVVFTGDAANVTWDKSTDDLIFNDNAKAAFGTGSDLEIYFDGSHSYLKNGSGSLRLSVAGGSDEVQINKGAVDENMAKFIADGAVELYYDGVKKFETTSSGISVDGTIAPTNHVNLVDNKKAQFGTGYDFQIYHDGTNSLINNDTGDLFIQADAGSGGKDWLHCVKDGAVELHHNGNKKLETVTGGATVTGTISAGAASFTDDGSAGPVINISGDDSGVWYGRIGNETYHDNVGTGFKFYVQDDGDALFTHYGNAEYRDWSIGSHDGTTSQYDIYRTAAGAVYLYNSGNVKLQTTGTGISVTGDTASTTFSDGNGDLRKIIPNNNLGTDPGAWTPNSNHCGHVNYMSRAGGVNITTSSFVDGNIITIVNSGTSDMTITQGTGMTIHFSADGTSGNRTLAEKGMCNIYFISSTEGYISGAGLT